jgi:hypothetical protein
MRASVALPIALQAKLLRSVLEFMVKSGASAAAIRECFARELSGLSAIDSSGARQDGSYVGNGNVSAELLRLWHRDGRYIDRDARPKPLLLTRGRSSLTSIIVRLDPSANPAEILTSMKAVGLLRKTSAGRYLPTAESVTIGQLHPLAVEHVAKSVIRLVSTVCRNTDPARQTMPLIERYAYVPDLSRAELRAFADFTRSQGMAYLEAVDDWLEQRRVRRQKKARGIRAPGVTAGVHLVAYLGDDSGSDKRSRLSKGATRPTGAPMRSLQERKAKRPTASREARA